MDGSACRQPVTIPVRAAGGRGINPSAWRVVHHGIGGRGGRCVAARSKPRANGRKAALITCSARRPARTAKRSPATRKAPPAGRLSSRRRLGRPQVAGRVVGSNVAPRDRGRGPARRSQSRPGPAERLRSLARPGKRPEPSAHPAEGALSHRSARWLHADAATRARRIPAQGPSTRVTDPVCGRRWQGFRVRPSRCPGLSESKSCRSEKMAKTEGEKHSLNRVAS